MALTLASSRLDRPTCAACGRLTATHHTVNGRWVGCTVDVVIGQDQETRARRLRLALLQSRVRQLRPFGIDTEADA